MVNEGWGFADLMAMSASDFSMWFEHQIERNKRLDQAARPSGR
jgi:hypothetical protein